jgi:hypothetical protein
VDGFDESMNGVDVLVQKRRFQGRTVGEHRLPMVPEETAHPELQGILHVHVHARILPFPAPQPGKLLDDALLPDERTQRIVPLPVLLRCHRTHQVAPLGLREPLEGTCKLAQIMQGEGKHEQLPERPDAHVELLRQIRGHAGIAVQELQPDCSHIQ